MTTSVRITKNIYGGDGLGRLGDGRVVFVPGAWAGETVKAEIFEEHRHHVRARLVEVETASPDRIVSPVPKLPGMVYADLAYSAELKAKEAQLLEFFNRARLPFGDFRSPEPGRALNYRNKAVYHFARERGDWVLGYREEPSHRIVDVTVDPLAREEINAKLPEIRRHLRQLLTTGPQGVRKSIAAQGDLTVRWTNKTGVKWWIGAPAEELILKETTAGLDFEVPADGFYQVNPEVGEKLVAAVGREVRAAAGATPPSVVDLYCGVGVFGLSLKPVKLLGIESGRRAIAFAKRNAAAQGMTNARFFAEEVGRNLRRIPIRGDSTVIIDPPRDGLEKGVAQWLARSKAPLIVYVSCDPATLMRDLKILAAGYRVRRVEWFDMFPRTARFETLTVLEKL